MAIKKENQMGKKHQQKNNQLQNLQLDCQLSLKHSKEMPK